MNCETPMAKIVAACGQSPLRVRKPALGTPSPNHVRLPKMRTTKIDVVALLLEERQEQR